MMLFGATDAGADRVGDVDKAPSSTPSSTTCVRSVVGRTSVAGYWSRSVDHDEEHKAGGSDANSGSGLASRSSPQPVVS